MRPRLQRAPIWLSLLGIALLVCVLGCAGAKGPYTVYSRPPGATLYVGPCDGPLGLSGMLELGVTPIENVHVAAQFECFQLVRSGFQTTPPLLLGERSVIYQVLEPAVAHSVEEPACGYGKVRSADLQALAAAVAARVQAGTLERCAVEVQHLEEEGGAWEAEPWTCAEAGLAERLLLAPLEEQVALLRAGDAVRGEELDLLLAALALTVPGPCQSTSLPFYREREDLSCEALQALAEERVEVQHLLERDRCLGSLDVPSPLEDSLRITLHPSGGIDGCAEAQQTAERRFLSDSEAARLYRIAQRCLVATGRMEEPIEDSVQEEDPVVLSWDAVLPENRWSLLLTGICLLSFGAWFKEEDPRGMIWIGSGALSLFAWLCFVLGVAVASGFDWERTQLAGGLMIGAVALGLGIFAALVDSDAELLLVAVVLGLASGLLYGLCYGAGLLLDQLGWYWGVTAALVFLIPGIAARLASEDVGYAAFRALMVLALMGLVRFLWLGRGGVMPFLRYLLETYGG